MNEELYMYINLILDTLTSIGTVGATITALIFGLSGKRKKLDINLVWDDITKNKPTLFLYNASTKSIALKNITLTYKGTNVATKDYTQYTGLDYEGYMLPETVHKIQFDEFDLGCVETWNFDTDKNVHVLEICITDITNKKFTKKIKISEKKVKLQKAGNVIRNQK